MRILLLLTFLLSGELRAEIQVPDDCVGKISPCLIRADRSVYTFALKELKVKIPKDGILKITTEANHYNFDIIVGRVEIVQPESSTLSVSVNSVLQTGGRIMAARFGRTLQVLSLNNFTVAEYEIQTGSNDFPERVKSVFPSKRELVNFTKYYFSNVADFKNFLASIESGWKDEFKRQNESQTKALMRSVASEEAKVEAELRQKRAREAELKKARSDLFFRTFQR